MVGYVKKNFGYGNPSDSTLTVKKTAILPGNINGLRAGGIFGSNANRKSQGGAITVRNSYSSGKIEGDQAGGIFGYSANRSARLPKKCDDYGNKLQFKWNDEGDSAGEYFGYSASVNSNSVISQQILR